MTTVRAGDGWTYTLTEEDYLWLGRATHAEGGDVAANIWTWLQRLVRYRASSLTNLVRAHSQPVNPKWMRNGEFCVPGGRGYGGAYCEEDDLARRAEHAARAPSAWNAATKAAIALLRKGQLPNPVPRAVNFADPPTSEDFIARTPGAFILRCDGNCYIVDAVSKRWPEGWVTLGSSFGRAVLHTALWVTLLGATGYAVWKYAR